VEGTMARSIMASEKMLLVLAINWAKVLGAKIEVPLPSLLLQEFRGDAGAFEGRRLVALPSVVVRKARRMRGGNKTLKRIFYQSAAFASLRASPQSRAFYERKRAEGKRHTQALIAPARRRVNILWAMLHDGTTFETRSAA
jgi:hypothetical protein